MIWAQRSKKEEAMNKAEKSLSGGTGLPARWQGTE